MNYFEQAREDVKDMELRGVVIRAFRAYFGTWNMNFVNYSAAKFIDGCPISKHIWEKMLGLTEEHANAWMA